MNGRDGPFGGRGALKLAMVNADLFSVAYAMHPVATGTGDIRGQGWRLIGRGCKRRGRLRSWAGWGGRRSSGRYIKRLRQMWRGRRVFVIFIQGLAFDWGRFDTTGMHLPWGGLSCRRDRSVCLAIPPSNQ
jgi:hypothetical protein